MKTMRNLSILMLCITLFSCDSENVNKSVITESYETHNYERIGFPVKLHFVEKSGMKLMIASGSYGESGTSIINLTLDSLQVEYYKKQLNK